MAAGDRDGEAATFVAAQPRAPLRLLLCHLYPDLLNIYGDRGNVLALRRRAAWRGIAVEVREATTGEPVAWRDVDLLCMGGGEDDKQSLAASDLRPRADGLGDAVAAGLPVLAVCGSYQLLGRYYQPAAGPRLDGAGVFDAYTEAGARRMIGNVAVTSAFGMLTGFENHSGRTFLGPSCERLGTIVGRGGGNNGSDGGEGARVGNCIGTYLHGSLLPKNPALADFLLNAALERRYGVERASEAMRPLDDGIEHAANVQGQRWAAQRRAVW